jgi:nucleoside-diphosphate-sugar epimerase
MNSVMVTGAGGFVGRHTLLPLLTKGYKVYGIDILDQLPEIDLLKQKFGNNFEYHKINLLDSKSIDDFIKKSCPTHILHLAWYTRHGHFWSATENLDWVAASCNLLKTFITHGGSRIVSAGTCAEYQWSDDLLVEGKSVLMPGSLYGKAKLAWHDLAESFCSSNNISHAWARIFFLFGPFEHPDRFISSAIKSLLRNEQFLAGSGDVTRDFCFTVDVGRAFAQILDSDIKGDINIASGQELSIGDILQKLQNICGVKNLVRLGARPPSANEPKRIAASNRRLVDELGFQFEANLDERLSQTVQWWKSQI